MKPHRRIAPMARLSLSLLATSGASALALGAYLIQCISQGTTAHNENRPRQSVQ